MSEETLKNALGKGRTDFILSQLPKIIIMIVQVFLVVFTYAFEIKQRDESFITILAHLITAIYFYHFEIYFLLVFLFRPKPKETNLTPWKFFLSLNDYIHFTLSVLCTTMLWLFMLQKEVAVCYIPTMCVCILAAYLLYRFIRLMNSIYSFPWSNIERKIILYTYMTYMIFSGIQHGFFAQLYIHDIYVFVLMIITFCLLGIFGYNLSKSKISKRSVFTCFNLLALHLMTCVYVFYVKMLILKHVDLSETSVLTAVKKALQYMDQPLT